MKFYTMELDQLSEEKNDQVYIMPFQQSDIELHDHNFLELAYVTGGNAIQNLAGKKERVKEGDYFIIDFFFQRRLTMCLRDVIHLKKCFAFA